jgi:hypothetical protein
VAWPEGAHAPAENGRRSSPDMGLPTRFPLDIAARFDQTRAQREHGVSWTGGRDDPPPFRGRQSATRALMASPYPGRPEWERVDGFLARRLPESSERTAFPGQDTQFSLSSARLTGALFRLCGTCGACRRELTYCECLLTIPSQLDRPQTAGALGITFSTELRRRSHLPRRAPCVLVAGAPIRFGAHRDHTTEEE